VSSMASIFALVFSCCMRGHPQDPTVIDETSRLIPTSTDPSNEQPRVVVVDHQKLKDRLGNIVRSKEGKMVNVSAQIPFNLHNQTLNPRFHPSTSRSASLSTTSAYPTHNDHISNAHRPGLSTPPSRRSSPSRSVPMTHSAAPSISQPRRHSGSRSSSAQRGAPSQGGELEGYERNPILNVRLVGATRAPMVTGRAGGGGIPFGRRGRERGRLVVAPGRDADLNTRSADEGPPILPAVAATDRPPCDSEVQIAVQGVETQNPSAVPIDSCSPTTPIYGGGTNSQNGDFVIRDAGDISRSWGD